MSRYRLTPAAQRDLSSIWDYTEERWAIPDRAIGPHDMDKSPDFRRISGGAVHQGDAHGGDHGREEGKGQKRVRRRGPWGRQTPGEQGAQGHHKRRGCPQLAPQHPRLRAKHGPGRWPDVQTARPARSHDSLCQSAGLGRGWFWDWPGAQGFHRSTMVRRVGAEVIGQLCVKVVDGHGSPVLQQHPQPAQAQADA